MPFRSIKRLVAIVVLISSSALAQSTQPSTQPAAALDQTTPKGTLKLFFTADAHSDGGALRPLLLAETPAQTHMADAMTAKRDADRALTHALMVKFPDRWPADPLAQANSELPLVYDKIDQSGQEIAGDTATVHAGGEQAVPITLKRIDGKWLIPLGTLLQVVDADQLETNAHQIQIQVKVMLAAADDVKAGKYADMDKAVEDIKQRIFTASVDDHAATQPATQP
jgi:hypothetical protein